MMVNTDSAMKPNAAFKLPASLRPEGVRVHPGMPFGFPSQSAFGFAGILRVDTCGTALLQAVLARPAANDDVQKIRRLFVDTRPSPPRQPRIHLACGSAGPVFHVQRYLSRCQAIRYPGA